jgi:hypothetical protein
MSVRRGSDECPLGWSFDVLIRPALPSDIEPALAVMADAYGLPMRAPTVHTLVESLPDGHLLVACTEGEVVGTGAAIGFGSTAWRHVAGGSAGC